MTLPNPKTLLSGYAGSKFKLMPLYVPMFPKHRWYVSLFGGMCADFAHKPQTNREVYNDLDGHLFAIWSCLQDEKAYNKLVRRIENTPDSREHSHKTAQLLWSEDPIDKAYSFLVLTECGFDGPHPVCKTRKDNGQVWYRSGDRTRPSSLCYLPPKLAAWRDRFRRVRLEKLDWEEVVELYDAPTTFFFIDPPYDPTATSGRPIYYHQDIDHPAMLKKLSRIEGRAMICNYPSTCYHLYLRRWRKVVTPYRKTMRTKVRVSEVVWMNYQADGTRLDTDPRWLEEFGL